MLLPKPKETMKWYEAWRVYGALLFAAGQCMYDRLKLFPRLPFPRSNLVWRPNSRVVTTPPNKRKANVEHLEQQPPHKKIATDGPIFVPSNNSLASDIQGELGVQAPVGDSMVSPPSSSSSRRISGEAAPAGSRSRSRGDNRSLKMAAVLDRVWKDDLNSGRLLGSLFELFGESMLNFIPTPEMSMFL